MSRTAFALILTFGLALLLPSCGRDSGPDPASPEALISRFSRGMQTHNPEEVAACFDPEDKAAGQVLSLLKAGIEVIQKQRSFDQAVRTRYGDRFADEKMGMKGADPAAFFQRLETLGETTQVVLKGDEAEVTSVDAPQGTPPARLARKDGRWFFRVAPYLPKDPNLCEHLRHIFTCYGERYEQGQEALKKAADEAAFLEAMAHVNQQLAKKCAENMSTVMPFLEKYR